VLYRNMQYTLSELLPNPQTTRERQTHSYQMTLRKEKSAQAATGPKKGTATSS